MPACGEVRNVPVSLGVRPLTSADTLCKACLLEDGSAPKAGPLSIPRHPQVVSVLSWPQFEGGVVVISHDSQLLSRVCDDAERSEVWLVEDGEVERYDGYFEEYKAELVKEIADEMDED